MSVELTFTTVQLALQQEVNHEQSHYFQLQIFNKQYQESMKFQFHAINVGWIDLPKNYFVLPLGSGLSFRVQEKNQGRELDKMLSFGEFQLGIKNLDLEKAREKLREGVINSETFNKKFKISVNYRYRYLENRTFTGFFYGLLKNQGYQTLSLISMNQQHSKSIDHPQRQFLKQAPGKVTAVQSDPHSKSKIKSRHGMKEQKDFRGHTGDKGHNETSTHTLKYNSKKDDQNETKSSNDTKWSFKNFFSVCNNVEVQYGVEDIANEQLPDRMKPRADSKQITPKTKQMIDTESQKILETRINSTEKRQQQRSLQQKRAMEAVKQPVTFFKGPCKSKNAFSCIDPSVDQQQICIVEPVYR